MRPDPLSLPGSRLLDFADPAEAGRWSAVNDGVMGGLSSSEIVGTGSGSSLFAGRVSLENNGGFASARRTVAEGAFAGATHLHLTFLGDGKTYKLRLRSDPGFDGVNYEIAFATQADKWQAATMELADFAPVWRGRPVPDADPLYPERIQSVGFLISGGQEGPFRLELAALSASTSP